MRQAADVFYERPRGIYYYILSGSVNQSFHVFKIAFFIYSAHKLKKGKLAFSPYYKINKGVFLKDFSAAVSSVMSAQDYSLVWATLFYVPCEVYGIVKDMGIKCHTYEGVFFLGGNFYYFLVRYFFRVRRIGVKDIAGKVVLF